MAFTVDTAPWTTLRTPGGKPWEDSDPQYRVHRWTILPARWHSSAIIIAAPGSRSEGLRMRVFPVTAAMGIVHSGIILPRISIVHTSLYIQKAIRREIEGGYAGTDAKRDSSDLGIHVLANWRYKRELKMCRHVSRRSVYPQSCHLKEWRWCQLMFQPLEGRGVGHHVHLQNVGIRFIVVSHNADLQ